MFTRPYDDRPIPQTHVRRLESTARGWGLSPANHETASVLEVGCAHGVNLMAMAARLPGATFVGIDIDADAVAVARDRAAAAELANVRFEVGDVQTLEVTPGTFDYAIAHGLLSWVSEPVRRALFGLLRRTLSVEGIAYVSFDALPGAALRETLGLGLRGLGTDDVDRLRAVMSVLQDGASPGTLQGAWLRSEISAALKQPPSFLEHQFLSPHHRALAICEVWDEAQAQGLQYLDDLAETGLAAEALAETVQALGRVAPNRRAAEQLLDTAIHRQFRASLFTPNQAPLVRSGAEDVPEPLRAAVSLRPRVLALTQLEARELGFVSTPELGHHSLHPLHATLIEHLDGTRTASELEALVVSRVAEGRLSLPTESGAPATVQEAQSGGAALVASALEDLAQAGILLSTP